MAIHLFIITGGDNITLLVIRQLQMNPPKLSLNVTMPFTSSCNLLDGVVD